MHLYELGRNHTVAARIACSGSAALVALVLTVAITGCSGDTVERFQRFMDSGDRFAAEGKHREALIEYRNAVQLDQMSGSARLKLAEAYERTDDGVSALQEYVRAADLLPTDVVLQLKTGRFLLAARRIDDALMRADAVLKIESENVEAHVLRGNALGGLNDFDLALEAMEQALRLDPTRGATYTQIGLVESARGRLQQAEAAFKRAIELAPTSVDARLALANFYWAVDRHSDAAATLTATVQQDPSNERANHALAVFSLATGLLVEAEQYLRQLVSITKTEQSQLTLAEYYTATGRPAEALKILVPIASAPTASIDAKVRLSRAYAAAGDYGRAKSLADTILSAAPRDVSAQLLKAQLLLADRRRDEALETVKTAVAADPQSASAQFTLGRLYAARGDVPGAEAAFREVLKMNPSAAAAQTELSALHLGMGATTAALNSAEAAVQARPDRLDARLALVRALLSAKHFERAEAELKALTAAHPGSAPVLVQNAVLAASRNDQSAARALFAKALDSDPASLEALGGLLALDMSARNAAAVRNRLAAQLAKSPANAGLKLLAARTYASIGDVTVAEGTLREAIDLDPTMLPAYSLLGQLYMKQGRLTEALAEFDARAERESNPVGALTMAGMILESLNDAPQAMRRYERAVALNPRAAVAANNLAWLHAESDQHLDEALRIARMAAEALPDTPEVLDTLGWVYFKSGLASTAIPPFVRCIELDPENATCWYHVGLAYKKIGEAEKGFDALRRALSLSTSATWVADAKRELAGK